MDSWVRNIGIAFVFLIVLLILVGLLLPTHYQLSRSLVINSAPERIHQYVGDLAKWDLWSPWTEEDPSIVVRLGEKTTGIGASQTWVSSDGDGSLTLTMSSPSKGIEYELFLTAAPINASPPCITTRSARTTPRSYGACRGIWICRSSVAIWR